MAKSLADQLLGAGLVDDKKAKQVKHQKRKQQKQQLKGEIEADDTQQRLEQQRQEKIERDRALNRQRQAEEEAKAMQAQARQMLLQNRQPVDGDIRFNFTDRRINKIKRIFVSKEIQDHLASGKLAICAAGEEYLVVPRPIADKVAERFEEAVIFVADQNQNDDDYDPYEEFPIPDDLMW